MAAEGVVALLLAVLFFLLRRYAAERRYFLNWANAWVLVAVAIGVIGVQYWAGGVFGDTAVYDAGYIESATNFLYQLAKLVAFGLLVYGALSYARDIGRRFSLAAFTAAVAYTGISFAFSSSLWVLVIWQAPAIIVMSLIGAVLLLHAPQELRGVGTRMSGGMFVLIALVWASYLIALTGSSPQPVLGGVPRFLFNYNGWVDMLLDMLLAFGMVLILIDDVQRETDAAQTELKAAHAKLREESFRDSLTNVFNRRALHEGVGLQASGGAVVVCDLDNLKKVNDRYGHKCGDDLLKHFASIVKPQLRRGDKLYRFGGDEFLLVLPGARASEAVARIEVVLATAAPLQLSGTTGVLRLEASVGGADYRDLSGLQEAVVQADDAMYERKRERKPEFLGRELSADG